MAARSGLPEMTGSELKKEYESSRGQLKLGITALVAFALLTTVILTLLFDPLRWLDGPPEAHQAKKWIALCICGILFPAVSGIWFMVIRPLQTGITTSGHWGHNVTPRIILRSEEPGRFRFNIIWNCVLLAAVLVFGFAALRSSIRDLEKAKSQPVNRKVEKA
jgi:hypothetical protein